MGSAADPERVLALEASYETVGEAVTRAFEELLPRLEGKTVLSVPEQEEIKQRIAEFLAEKNPVTIRPRLDTPPTALPHSVNWFASSPSFGTLSKTRSASEDWRTPTW